MCRTYRVGKPGPIEHRPRYFVVASTTVWPRSWSGLSPASRVDEGRALSSHVFKWFR